MPVEKVLITVKTYPTLSSKYDELVCTAGVREDGSWVRIYPIPFRKMDYDKQYLKFSWIEADLIKNKSDPRPESFKLKDCNAINVVGSIKTDRGAWIARRPYVLKHVYTDMSDLIQRANNNELSLATFKPTDLCDFVWETTEREWDREKLDTIRARAMQTDLFCKAEDPFRVVDKIPYKFSYIFKDKFGKQSKMMIEDWEIGALYWNMLNRSNKDELIVCNKIKQKYWDNYKTKDLHFFLGTTRQFHGWAQNPFIIIGVFPPDYAQPDLFYKI